MAWAALAAAVDLALQAPQQSYGTACEQHVLTDVLVGITLCICHDARVGEQPQC